MVSIIVPVYNAENYIDECVKSLIIQRYNDIEIILVNDGSSDNSLNKCLEWKKKSSKVRVVDKKNGGVSSARNCGMKVARGEYISFVDSDDFVSEDYIESLLKHMKKDIDLVALGMSYYKDNCLHPVKYRLKSKIYTCDYLKKIVIDDGTFSGFCFHSCCTLLYKSSIIKKYNIQFNTNIKFNEDGLFNTEYVFYCKKNIFVDFSDRIYFYRVNQKSSTHVSDLLNESFTENMIKVEGELKKLIKGKDLYNINIQCERKFFTDSISQLLRAIKYESMEKIIRNERFVKSINLVNFRKLTLKKKVFFLIIKTKNIKFIYFIFKLI